MFNITPGVQDLRVIENINLDNQTKQPDISTPAINGILIWKSI